MKSIHFVGNLSNLRGLERQALIQCEVLNQHGIDCQLWTLTTSSECKRIFSNTYDLKIKTLSPKFLPLKEVSSFLSIFFLFVFSKSAKAAKIVHLHGLSRSCLPFLLFAKLFSKKVVVKLTNSGSKSVFLKMNSLGPIARYVLALSRTTVDRWICLNATSMNDAKLFGINENRLINIPNISLIPCQEHVISINKQTSKFSVVYAGSFASHKNPQIAIEVARALETESCFHFYFAGDGEMFHHLSLNPPSNSTFCGMLSSTRLYELFRQSHIYLSTSSAEGMSNSLLEAIAFGLTPVVTNIEANSNILGADYKYLNPLSTDSFVESIRTIARERSSPISHISILEKYSKSSVSKSLLKLYQNLCFDPII